MESIFSVDLGVDSSVCGTMSGQNSNSNLIGQLGFLQQFLPLGTVTGQTLRNLPPPVQTTVLQTGNVVPPSSPAWHHSVAGHEQSVETLDQGQSRTEQQAATQIGCGSTYTYMIKLINPKRKSDFTIRNWYDVGEKFDTISDLKCKLMATFSDELSAKTFQLGYLEPPSQAKRWLQEQRDLDGMYTIFPPGTKITLWCEKALCKETTEAEVTEPPSKRKAQTARDKSEEELDEIFGKLKEKHPNIETVKLRLWGKLIQSGHHDSYEAPPDIPLLSGSVKKMPPKEGVADMIAGAATAIVKAINNPTKEKSPTKVHGLSPLKAMSIRRSCLDDLKRVKELVEDNILTEAEFAEKDCILKTLRGLGK